jgi:hypothetical protein
MIHCFISGQEEEGERIKVAESTREHARMPATVDALWQRRLNEQPTRQLRPLTAPLLHTLRHLPLGFRFPSSSRVVSSCARNSHAHAHAQAVEASA